MSEKPEHSGILYIVGTPIGNLGDMSPRAVDILQHAGLIACEDTRTSGQLLKHFDISAQTTSFHQHNEHKKTAALVDKLRAGVSVALISDAGMPALSDPGFLLTRAAHQQGIPVIAVPGPFAGVTALAASGLPSDRFIFEGFLPQKKGRKTRIEELRDEKRTVIYYESPYRVVKLLEELSGILGPDRLCAVCRELTKMFEEVKRGRLGDLLDDYRSRPKIKGEFVVITAGADYTEEVPE